MATNAKNAPTDINKQDERQQDNTRMTFAGSPATAPTSTSTAASVAATTTLPQQKRRQEQCNAKILQELLGIVAQPQVATTLMLKPDAVVADKQKQQQIQQSHVELSQIELIYRAEGNANLVLALPQFKKVLRLPKTSTTSHSNNRATEYNEMKIGNTQQQTDEAKVVEGRQADNKEWQLHQEHRQQRVQQQQQKQHCQQKSQEKQSQHQPQQQKQQEVVQSASEPAVNQNAKG